MNYLLHLVIILNIYALVALSLNLVVGYCGLLTLAHAGYYAIGAYTYALATLKFGWGFGPAALLGMIIPAFLSLAVSLPAWRLRGDFFVIVSLAIQTLIFSFLHNWYSSDAPIGTWRNLTNGPFGLASIPPPSQFGLTLNSAAVATALSMVALIIICSTASFLVERDISSHALGAFRECVKMISSNQESPGRLKAIGNAIGAAISDKGLMQELAGGLAFTALAAVHVAAMIGYWTGFVGCSTGGMAALSTVICFLSGGLFAVLKTSPWGRLLKATRDDELAARGLGKNTRLAKVQAFAVACAFAGLAGSMYAAYARYIDSSAASLDGSILMLSMVLVGGVGNFRGPLVGAAVLIAIPEVLRYAHLPDPVASNARLLVYGLMLAALMRFRPQGIAGEYRLR